jgi:hypothetical protein
VTAVVALVLGLVATACMPPLVEPPTSGRDFGEGPLDAVYTAASAKADCGLDPIQLAALMMAPTYSEAGGPVPSPMALSRWDNLSVSSSNARLFAFGQTSGPYVNAFFSPGIGMWQFDSAGAWPFSAAGAIDSVTSADQAATTMAYRWCNAPTSQQATPQLHRKYAWGPWYGCSTTSVCENVYTSLVAGEKLDTAFDPSVTRYGGMQRRTCNVEGLGEGLTCWYVNPALAQGSKGWTGGTYNGGTTGVTPLPKPFYVIEFEGREYRIWLKADTGYDIGITASKPITANARTSLTWSGVAALCDVTADRGECLGGADPEGWLDVAAPAGPEKLRVAGWALDRDTVDPIAVHVYVDTVGTAIRADLPRPDVAAAVPGYGERHGFDRVIPAAPGPHEVCAYGINVQRGTNTLLACRTVVVTGKPDGHLDGARGRPARIDVTGWVSVPFDPDAPAVLTVDGTEAARLPTDVARPDVEAAVPAAGATTGFSGSISATAGSHRVCLSAGGAEPEALGCRTVTVPGGSPVGSLDSVRSVPGGVSVGGWAIDPDTGAPIAVHVYVGSTGSAIRADGERPDVGAAYPDYGAAHGFNATLKALAGSNQVCAYAINTGVGSNTLLGCRTVTVRSGSPFGSLDAVTRTATGLRAAGWAIDPDTGASIPVHVYVGATGTAWRADSPRPDVAAAFPGYGEAHGFVATPSAPATPVTVCAYAIETVAPGQNVLLGCRTV